MAWLVLLTEPTALVGWGLLALTVWAFHGGALVAWRYGGMGLALGFFWCATPLGANIMVAALEDNRQVIEPCAPDPRQPVVVVLAGGKSGQPTRADDFSRLHEASYRRTIEGMRLAQQLPGSTVVVSGGGGMGVVREADLMHALLVALGFLAHRIIAERDSQTTHTSAVTLRRVLDASTNPGIHLVTSALHMRRAAAVFTAHGWHVCPYAVDARWMRSRPAAALVPQISALSKSTAAVHEAVGWLWYWGRGKWQS